MLGNQEDGHGPHHEDRQIHDEMDMRRPNHRPHTHNLPSAKTQSGVNRVAGARELPQVVRACEPQRRLDQSSQINDSEWNGATRTAKEELARSGGQ